MRRLFQILKGKSAIYYLTMISLLGNLLYSIFPFPPIVWRLMFAILGVYAVSRRVGRCTKIEKSLLLFMGIYSMSFIVRVSNTLTYLGDVLCLVFSLPLYLMLVEEGQITRKEVSYITVLFIVSAIYFYVNSKVHILERIVSDSSTINESRVFLFLLPLLFYEKRNWLFFAELFICIFFIFDAVKRGVIISASIPILMLLYPRLKERDRSKSRFLLIILILIGFYFLREQVLDNDYFWKRYEDTLDGDDSTRSEIYESVWQFFLSDKNHFKLFGNGYNSCYDIIGSMAHNDWLETLINNGIVGVIVMMTFYWRLYRSSRIAINKTSRMVLLSAFIIMFSKSLYSMSFIEDLSHLVMLPVAVALHNKDQCELDD